MQPETDLINAEGKITQEKVGEREKKIPGERGEKGY